jgi:ATP-binding cassette subfamily C (CFTR/MRP) protein 1
VLHVDTYDNAAAVTFMSTDVDRISSCLEELNECWSRPIEICIGIPLLARQLGWVSLIPLLVIGCKCFTLIQLRALKFN